jgi:hypothetical protein
MWPCFDPGAFEITLPPAAPLKVGELIKGRKCKRCRNESVLWIRDPDNGDLRAHCKLCGLGENA